MQLEYFQLTMVGDRDVNQDYMAHIVNDDYALFVVADGLGGHHAGEKASQYFCQSILQCAKTYAKKISEMPVIVFLDWIDDAIDQMKVMFANDPMAIYAHTTCAILYLDKKIAVTAHCGDTRVYRMNPQEILWRTKDHSIPQELLEAGLITEPELATHPDQNQLTRSISVNKIHPIDVQTFPPIKHDETFVLCSDGFWENVKVNEFLQLADLTSSKETIAKLGRLSVFRARGRSDNVTVMSVRCRQGS